VTIPALRVDWLQHLRLDFLADTKATGIGAVVQVRLRWTTVVQ